MGDVIRLFQEKQIPELDALADYELLSQAELKNVVQKRTDFEYKIVSTRGTARSGGVGEKADFLRYIQFESNLNQLIRIRIRKAEFCKKSHLFEELKYVFSRAMQMHPTYIKFWVMAATWEWEHNRNMTTARAIFQLGLRVNKLSEELWHEYFYLELVYWRKIAARMHKSLIAPESKGHSINLAQLQKGLETSGQDVTGVEALLQERITPFLAGEIPKIIYRNALQAIGKDALQFRISLYETSRKFPIAGSVQQLIMSDLTTDFPNHPVVVALRADLCTRGKAQSVETYTVAFEAFESVIKNGGESEALWMSYLHFIRGKVCSAEYFYNTLVNFLTEQFVSVLERVPSAVRVTACATFAPTLLQLGLPDKAHQLLLSAIEIDPHNAMCWKLLMELELKQGTTSAANTLSHFEKAVKLSHPPDINLWVMYIQWLIMVGSAIDVRKELKIAPTDNVAVSVAIRCLRSVFSTLQAEDYSSLKDRLLDVILLRCGIDIARLFIAQAVAAPPNTLSFYKHCIAIEQAHLTTNPHYLQALYEKAVQEHGSGPECEPIWLDYIKLETKQLRLDRATDLYWRAKKTLTSPESFISKFEGLK